MTTPSSLPTSYAVQHELTSPKWCRAFALGSGGVAIPAVADNGDVIATELRPGPAAFFGSPKLWPLITSAQARQSTGGPDYFYGDHAYFRRGRYYRITRNRLQHDGRPTPGRQYSIDRLRSVGGGDLQPWQEPTSAGHIVICPNSPAYMALFGLDAKQWALDCMTALSKLTDRPMILRWKAQAAARPLYVDLVGAYCVVVFSSNSAVEGLLAGVPCITLADFAASYRMGRHSLAEINDLYYPEDREIFLTVLAHNQWTITEMERGDAWRIVRRDH